MAWDPVSVIGGTEPLYFGPLAEYDTEELDRRGIDQDKKTTKGFKWISAVTGSAEAASGKTKTSSATSQEKQPLDPGLPSSELSQGLRSKKLGRDELPTWDEFTQKTTFHGVRYIFDKTRFKIRRYQKITLSFSSIGRSCSFYNFEINLVKSPDKNPAQCFNSFITTFFGKIMSCTSFKFQNSVALQCCGGTTFIHRASRQQSGRVLSIQK